VKWEGLVLQKHFLSLELSTWVNKETAGIILIGWVLFIHCM